MKDLFSKIVDYLTPFSWRKFVSLIAIACAVALALYLTGCHVQRTVTSFGTVKYDRIDTIRYNSEVHKDSRGYVHYYKP